VQVREGADLVNGAGASLGEIAESTKKVAAIIADIASASAEQAIGIEQINKTLTQMDEATQQNWTSGSRSSSSSAQPGIDRRRKRRPQLPVHDLLNGQCDPAHIRSNGARL
jgi:methyl-accepting chemotaxis protein